MPPRRLVPIFIDADRIGDLEEVLRRLGIEAFSTSDGHRGDLHGLYHPVPQQPELELQDDASLHDSDGCSINQFTYGGRSLTDQSSEFEELTETLSSLSMSTNSHHVGLYPARGAPALRSRSPPVSSPQKKRYYVITVGKCAGIYYDEWYAYAFVTNANSLTLTCHP
jgi:hypothetical protein